MNTTEFCPSPVLAPASRKRLGKPATAVPDGLRAAPPHLAERPATHAPHALDEWAVGDVEASCQRDRLDLVARSRLRRAPRRGGPPAPRRPPARHWAGRASDTSGWRAGWLAAETYSQGSASHAGRGRSPGWPCVCARPAPVPAAAPGGAPAPARAAPAASRRRHGAAAVSRESAGTPAAHARRSVDRGEA